MDTNKNITKQALLRALLGFPLGVFISVTIGLIISGINISLGNSGYLPATPALIESAGGEFNAALLQYVLSGLLGAAFAAGSCIWEMESWSLLRQTVTHFLLSVCVALPIVVTLRWVPGDVLGYIFYVMTFVAIYFAIWFSVYLSNKKNVAKINSSIKNK